MRAIKKVKAEKDFFNMFFIYLLCFTFDIAHGKQHKEKKKTKWRDLSTGVLSKAKVFKILYSFVNFQVAFHMLLLLQFTAQQGAHAATSTNKSPLL